MLDTRNLPLAVSIAEATQLLPIKSTKMRALIAAGVIRSHFLGGKRAIPISEIERLASGEIQF